jgi:DNA modification methylase
VLKLGDNKEVVKDLPDLMKYMPENGLVELVVMDPPYGQNKGHGIRHKRLKNG